MSRGPKFDLVATATLCLNEVHDSIKSHDLILENLGKALKKEYLSVVIPENRANNEIHNSLVHLSCIHTHYIMKYVTKADDYNVTIAENPCLQLPLFDHFCCRLAAQPDCLSTENVTNVSLKYPVIKIKNKSSNAGVVFAVLCGFTLEFWKKREHREKAKSPLLTLTLDHVRPAVLLTVEYQLFDVVIVGHVSEYENWRG